MISLNKHPRLFSLALCIVFACIANFTFAQSEFNKKLRELVIESAKCIESSGNKKVGVWGFFNDAGIENTLGRYMTSKFPIYMSQSGDLDVIDRKNLNLLLQENNLSAEGLIDKNTAKELGKVAALDLIISGTIWIFENKVELNLIMLDTETAVYTCSTEAYFELNDDLYSLLGIKPPDFKEVNYNRGFNRPLNSGEFYNDPSSVDSKCADGNGFGDFCFVNNKAFPISVKLAGYNLVLNSGETRCFYGRKPGSGRIDIYKYDTNASKAGTKIGEFEIVIEQCRSKTIVLN